MNTTEDLPIPYGSNDLRLSARQWLATILITTIACLAIPRLWQQLEPFEPAADYRTPYALSDDYWLFQRWMTQLLSEEKIAIIGDSVVWGEYVAPADALSESINRHLGADRIANAGLNGSHPLALEGLARHYCAGLRGRAVLLHCNLLWMSSPERDLQVDKEVAFNHPRLIPQLARSIPSHRAAAEDRIGNAVDRHFALRGWVHHLRIAHFGNLDLPNWTLEHPYENPLTQVSLSIPGPSAELRHQPIAWFERGIEPQEMEWVDGAGSVQLAAFQRTVQLLRDRGNSVFVIVGPFNEHLLLPESRDRYRQLRDFTRRWLEQEAVPHRLPALLPSEEYGDASHPLAAGYDRLAADLVRDPRFQAWLP